MQHLRLLPRTDLYFAKTFLRLLGLVFVAILGLLIVADLFQKYDEFVSYAEDSGKSTILVYFMVLQYYLTFAPAMLLRYLLPLVFMLAAILTVSTSCSNNEYTVLRSSGVSLPRAIAPILAAALVVGFLIEFSRDSYLPSLLRRGHAVATTIKPKGALPISLVLRDGDEMQAVSMGHFDQYENRYVAHNLRIEVRNISNFFGGSDEFVAYTAWEAYLQPRTDPDRDPDDKRELQWKSHKKGRVWEYSRFRRDNREWSDPVPTLITPAMLERQVLGEAVMSWNDLSLLAREELDARVEMHARLSNPWALTTLLFLGITLVLRISARGGQNHMIVNIVIGVALCGAFYIVRNSFRSFGELEYISPLMAGWMPVILFGGTGTWFASRLGR